MNHLSWIKHNTRCLLSLIVPALFIACSHQPRDMKMCNQTPDIYPDYVGVTIPVDIAPLNFSMVDDSVSRVDVTVEGEKGGNLHTNGTFADFDIDEWHKLTRQNCGGKLTVTVCAEKNGQWTQYQPFNIFVSTDSLGEWGITYRRIPPSYIIYSRMGLYQRNLSNFDEEALLINTQVPGACINCHTANRTNPDQFVFHVRGGHGATIVSRDGNIELLKARNDSLGGSMVYPSWHPGGRFCAFSTNQTSQMFHTANPKRIEVYDSSSDVFIYDTETRTILSDTLIMKELWAENTPAFSHDGKWLYFITARRQAYPDDYDKERYSLCRVAFDEKTGSIGNEVDTLIQADTLGRSISWPRPSYDGRFLMFTQTDYGYFSVWHPESDLWLLDLQTMESRCMDEVNSPRAESLHSWSANSRWFLFTSRRDDGLYTRIYFASVDANGKATKPFMLPQHNPKRYYQQLLYSYNTPDFTSRPVKYDARTMGNLIESDQRTATEIKDKTNKE